jgi:hypothetical protein
MGTPCGISNISDGPVQCGSSGKEWVQVVSVALPVNIGRCLFIPITISPGLSRNMKADRS